MMNMIYPLNYDLNLNYQNLILIIERLLLILSRMTKNLEGKKLDLFYLMKLVNQELAKISHLIKLKKV